MTRPEKAQFTRVAGRKPARRDPQEAVSVEVAAGVVISKGKILITRRRQGDHLGGYWEFPGGKCLPGESPQDCVARETFEELGVRVTPIKLLEEITYRYPDRLLHFFFYECRLKKGEVKPRQTDRLAWVKRSHLPNHRFPPANKPLIRRLAARDKFA